jgi:hypothetical protein
MSAEQWYVVVLALMAVALLAETVIELRWQMKVKPALLNVFQSHISYNEVLRTKLTECNNLWYSLHEDSTAFWQTFVDQEQVDRVLNRLMGVSREDFLRFRAAAEERGFQVHSFPVDAPI